MRSGTTENGEYSTSFKTAMEFGIKISAEEKGIPFIVAVSAGIELFPASNLFVDAGTMRRNTEPTQGVVDIASDESTGSGNTMLITIICGLILIVGLLVILLLKRKARGTATIFIILFALSPLNANVPVGVSQSVVGKMAVAIAKALANHYGRGGYRNDDPLSEDDKDHEPETDPRGQPTLPSSCYDIARISQSGSSSGGGSPKGGGPSKNPDNEMTPGGFEGSESNPSEEGKNQSDIDELINEHRKTMERSIQETRDAYDQSLRNHGRDYEHILRTTTEDYTKRAIAAAENGNIEEQIRLLQELEAREKELDDLSRQRIEELQQQRDRLIEGHIDYFNNRILEIMEAQAEEDRQNEGKDEDIGPKKNEDPEEDPKGQGKGAGDPTDPGTLGGPGSGDPGEDDKSEGCDCLERAYKELQENRYTLEKLLKIGQHTKKVTDFGISFGDNYSGIHGVSGLAWQTERAKVIKSIEKFDKTYDNKYKELIDKLYNTLIWIDDCEKQLGYENWYSHSGFIYYEFMKARYASYK